VASKTLILDSSIQPTKKRNHLFNTILRQADSIKSGVLTIYFVFFATSFFLVSVFDKVFLHKSINTFHAPFLDLFFKYTTFLGDGIMFGVLFLIFFFIDKRLSYVFAVGGILTLLITHFFKKIIFKGLPRPVAEIGENALHLIEGVKIALANTFPSGHSTTAFAIFTILCLYYYKCKSQYLWISLAILAGFSRVYLSQHFLIDIFVGSTIGIGIGFISMAIFCKPLRRLH